MDKTKLPPIPVQWVLGYVDQLMALAERLQQAEEGGPVHRSLLLRASHALDLLEAWKEKQTRGELVDEAIS